LSRWPAAPAWLVLLLLVLQVSGCTYTAAFFCTVTPPHLDWFAWALLLTLFTSFVVGLLAFLVPRLRAPAVLLMLLSLGGLVAQKILLERGTLGCDMF
jgi:hypothetical protein